MRKTIFLLFMALATAMMSAQPKLIGHRGSYWGVESSKEAFIAGAKKGYLYLETDVKVTADGAFILIHDDNTSNLGGNLDITKSTLEQLQAENYTQTRGGVTYTGKICTLEEYLQICKDYGAIPFIELKWATGINNNDCSNLGRMVDKVIEYGFGGKAIINTSMKPCLEFIRRNYPDFKLMFLCNTNWESNFDWCVAQDIGPYIETGCFDRNTVTKFHEKGLKVGVWTVNTNASYKTYGNYGCDFIAVDYLDPAALPELDPFSALVPNKIDYPDHRGIIQQEYSFIQTAMTPAKAGTVVKSVACGSKIYKLSADGRIVCSDIDTGTDSVVEEGIADIAVTADGLLATCTAPESGEAEIRLHGTDGTMPLTKIEGCAENVAFCISGTSGEWKVYHTVPGGIRAISSDGQTAVNAIKLEGQRTALTVSPFSRDNLIADSPETLPAEYSFNWEEDGTALKPFMAMNATAGVSPQQASVAPFRYGAKIYAAAYTGTGFSLLDITGGLAEAKLVGNGFSSQADSQSHIAAFAEVSHGYIHVYTVVDASVCRYSAAGEEPEGNIGETDFRIEKLWSCTDNEGNAPEHIDGTNAQQGAAVKGVFYINDCSDKLIYVYTKDGLAGTLPGGKGWGAASDDAGNIIVRDDKDTGSSHRILIYPAGTMPGGNTEATAVDFEVPAAGQTNFISASGDVLGEGGYIYLYPNGQSVVNMVKIAGGRFVEATRSGDLSIAGSTAGYVIPIKNNPENWLYMVRNQGIYRYNGGDAGLLLGGSSTRPPVRNSTCGAEFFTLSSHDILVFNSGANYTGGFTIKDVTENKYIENISPIGSKGYSEGGNYSVSNWMTAEKIDAGSYYLYQYCPANGIAVYRFWDANYVPEGGINRTEEAALRIYPNPAKESVTVEGCSGKAAIYSLSGALVKETVLSGTSRIDISGFLPGIYILRTDSGKTQKFVKQ